LKSIFKTSFSPAEKIGILALSLAFLLYFFGIFWSTLPLIFFLLVSIAAAFFPGVGFYLPVISRGQKGERGIALTFDDGPSPASTPIILELLARHRLPATFFVIGEKAARYPELLTDIVNGGHTIGNHSWKHDYLLMWRSPETLWKDIHNTQEILKKSGIFPLVFRPPVGISGPRLHGVLSREGLLTVTYSCRAFDRGNRNIDNLAEKILNRLQPGGIIMLHDLPVYRSSEADDWQKELDRLFAALSSDYDTLPLEQLIGRPVTMFFKKLPEEPI